MCVCVCVRACVRACVRVCTCNKPDPCPSCKQPLTLKLTQVNNSYTSEGV